MISRPRTLANGVSRCACRRFALTISQLATPCTNERVGDQRTVAAPGHGFGAHEHDAVAPRPARSGWRGVGEIPALHVVGVAAKRQVAPACRWASPRRSAEAAEARRMQVADAGWREEAGSASTLNCGLWRERGTVRTSTSWVTPWAASSATNSSIGRVECPIVKTLQALASSSADVQSCRCFSSRSLTLLCLLRPRTDTTPLERRFRRLCGFAA